MLSNPCFILQVSDVAVHSFVYTNVRLLYNRTPDLDLRNYYEKNRHSSGLSCHVQTQMVDCRFIAKKGIQETFEADLGPDLWIVERIARRC